MLTLILPGKLEEARQIIAANWRLNAPPVRQAQGRPHANTTPRIAFLRHLIALLGSPGTSRTGDCADHLFPGQLKTLLPEVRSSAFTRSGGGVCV